MQRAAILSVLVLLASVCQLSCGKSGEPEPAAGPTAPTEPAGPEPAEPAEPAPTEQVGAAELTTLTASNTRFALDLYRKLASEDGNIAFSPVSVSFALAMTYAGARGETAAEMKSTLHFEQQPDKVHAGFADLLRKLTSSADYELAVANRLWGDKASKFLPAFLDLTEKYYGAPLAEVDFRGDPDGARVAINEWVAKQTRDKIEELLKPGIITAITRLVLTNAIYFKGKWEEEFEEEMTKDGPFYTPKGKVEVPMMHQLEGFSIHSDDSLQVLELPYKGGNVVMYVFLPRARDGLPALEKSLDADSIQAWTGMMAREQVNVQLPRFEARSSFGLKPMLEALGMKLAFSDAADLSGMNGAKDLFITAVVHEAYVKVDEEGSEAAAATAVVVGEKAARPQKPADFIADHPFLWSIYDKKSSSILFLGRVVDPRGA